MYVVATAGHVDHGKTTLVRALTGMDPDRLAEEKRRGLTIELGFAWTTLPSGRDVAFVDVPGHERFVSNALAGVAAVPAVVVVVAADEAWMPQTEEHVRAVEALGVRHGLVVITKTDVADPAPAVAAARERLGFLDAPEFVAVSAATGHGLDDLRAALDRLVERLPQPDPHAPVRLWVDRVFTIAGAGTVVTGTLGQGSLAVDDTLTVVPGGTAVTVRGLQSRGSPVTAATATSRVAVNLRGVPRSTLRRGMALVTDGVWTATDAVDVRCAADLPRQVVVHLGAAAVAAAVRRLGGEIVRLRLDAALPLHVGDRLLLRDPGSRTLVAADVADVDPEPVRRRGDAARVAAAVAAVRTADDVVRRRGWVAADRLRCAGYDDDPTDARHVGRWFVSTARWDAWSARVGELAAAVGPLDAGVAEATVRDALDAPDLALVRAVVAETPGAVLDGGRLRPRQADAPEVPELAELTRRLAADPFAAPDGTEVRALGADVLGFGVRTGLLLHLGADVYVAPDAPDRAVTRLQGLPTPFTVADARTALDSSRRVVVPLLEHLDATRRTRRLHDGTRVLLAPER